MQASKIMPKKIYAIEHDGTLARFYVDKIVTTRHDSTGSPHDYKSVVMGRVVEKGGDVTLPPEKVLGPYEEYAELKARRDAEQTAAKRKSDERKAAILRLRALLYALLDQPAPDNADAYRQLIRSSSDSVQISGDCVAALSAAIASKLGVGEAVS